jgi:flagellar assembly factor FliW
VEGLPELSFVYPLPGFETLRSFVLVRLDADGNETDATASDGHEIHAQDTDAEGRDVPSLDDAGTGGPVLYELRSVEQPDTRFLVGMPGAFFPDYQVELDDETCADLGLVDQGDALVLVIMSAPPEIEPVTANLLAPIVINKSTRTAAQVILNGSAYPVRANVG